MNFNYPTMQAGYGGFNGPNPPVDQYRQQNIPNGSPIQPPVSQMPQMPAGQTPFEPPGFGMGMGNYGYGNMGSMPNMGPSTRPRKTTSVTQWATKKRGLINYFQR
jgi:protein JSN1